MFINRDAPQIVLHKAEPEVIARRRQSIARYHPYQPQKSRYRQFKNQLYANSFDSIYAEQPVAFPYHQSWPSPPPTTASAQVIDDQRKLSYHNRALTERETEDFPRLHSQPFFDLGDSDSPRNLPIPVKQERTMEAPDRWIAEGYDGLSDSFEAQQLHNGYLSGSAGSPFSHADLIHNMSTHQALSPLAPLPSHPAKSMSSSSEEFPFHGMTENMFPDGLPGLPYEQASHGLHQDLPPYSLATLHYDTAMCHDPAESPANGLETFESFSSNSGGTTISHGLGLAGSSFSSTGSGDALDSFHPLEANTRAWSEVQATQNLHLRALFPQDLPDDNPSPCLSASSRDMELDAEGAPPMAAASKDNPMVEPQPEPASKATQKQKKQTKDPRPKFSPTQATQSKPAEPKTIDPRAVETMPPRKGLPDKASQPRQPLPDCPKPTKAAPSKPKPRAAQADSIPSPDPAPATDPMLPSAMPPVKPVSTTEWSMERLAKDEFLLRSKREGMTYKEIRKAGGFREAESTLRGRYRTLTKKKEERVRRPEWSEKDIRLLRRGVTKFAKETESGRVKVPWKQVAGYIQQEGGSYLFGNATCRKKWDELVQSGDDNVDCGDEDDE